MITTGDYVIVVDTDDTRVGYVGKVQRFVDRLVGDDMSLLIEHINYAEDVTGPPVISEFTYSQVRGLPHTVTTYQAKACPQLLRPGTRVNVLETPDGGWRPHRDVGHRHPLRVHRLPGAVRSAGGHG